MPSIFQQHLPSWRTSGLEEPPVVWILWCTITPQLAANDGCGYCVISGVQSSNSWWEPAVDSQVHGESLSSKVKRIELHYPLNITFRHETVMPITTIYSNGVRSKSLPAADNMLVLKTHNRIKISEHQRQTSPRPNDTPSKMSPAKTSHKSVQIINLHLACTTRIQSTPQTPISTQTQII